MATATAFYDLEHGPVSFDVVTWLVRARFWQVERARCERLHVVVVPKEDGLGGFSRFWGPHDADATRWRLWHIVLPAIALAGATVTLADSRAQAKTLRTGEWWWPEGKAHLAKDLVALARAGHRLPVFEASAQARQYVAAWLADDARPLFTLTLRAQVNDPARNADRREWMRLAEALRADGARVEVLDDTHRALGEGRGYAELDLDLRLALYERAAMNVVGNNGPAALLWHSRAPYLRIGAGRTADWLANLGLRDGEDVPWALPGQHCVYAPDTCTAMREAIDRWAGATS